MLYKSGNNWSDSSSPFDWSVCCDSSPSPPALVVAVLLLLGPSLALAWAETSGLGFFARLFRCCLLLTCCCHSFWPRMDLLHRAQWIGAWLSVWGVTLVVWQSLIPSFWMWLDNSFAVLVPFSASVAPNRMKLRLARIGRITRRHFVPDRYSSEGSLIVVSHWAGSKPSHLEQTNKQTNRSEGATLTYLQCRSKE